MYVSHAKTENLRGTTSDRRKVEFIVTYEASRWDGRRSILDIPIWSSSELQTRREENLSSLVQYLLASPLSLSSAYSHFRLLRHCLALQGINLLKRLSVQ